jgi:hypothetical protein
MGKNPDHVSMVSDRFKKSETDKDNSKRHKKSLVSKAFALTPYISTNRYTYNISRQYSSLNYMLVQKVIAQLSLRGPPAAC